MQVLGNFTLYDYNEPLAVPAALHGAFAVIVADPPYLVRAASAMALLCSCQRRTGQPDGLMGAAPALLPLT